MESNLFLMGLQLTLGHLLISKPFTIVCNLPIRLGCTISKFLASSCEEPAMTSPAHG